MIFTCSGSNLVDSPRRQRAIRVILNAGRSRQIRSHITSTEYSSRAASAAGANLVGEGAREKEENKDNGLVVVRTKTVRALNIALSFTAIVEASSPPIIK